MFIDKLKSNRHSIYSLKYHLVVITKNKQKFINDSMLEKLEKIFRRLLKDKKCELLNFKGNNNYIHIFFQAPPHVQLSTLVNTLKTVSSRLIKKNFKKHLKKYNSNLAFWARSYCILNYS